MGRHELELDTKVKASPDKVWEVLSEPSNYPKWMKHLDRVEGAKKLKKGAKLKLISITPSKNEIKIEVEVTEFDPPNRLAWTSLEALWNGEPTEHVSDVETAFVLEPDGKGTTVKAMGAFQANTLKAKLGAGYLLNSKIKPELQKALSELKKMCE